jgi:hypothetical protein
VKDWTDIVNESKLSFKGSNATFDRVPSTTSLAAPTGLVVKRHLDAYVLRWDANTEKNLRGYIVYRDGQELPISPRGGTFYIDLGLRPGRHAKYALKAVDLSGNVSSRSPNVSTKTAEMGW